MNEKLMLLANERMLSSKAYVLVNKNGSMGVICDQSQLNAAEAYGQTAYVKGFCKEYVDQEVK